MLGIEVLNLVKQYCIVYRCAHNMANMKRHGMINTKCSRVCVSGESRGVWGRDGVPGGLSCMCKNVLYICF